MPVLVMIKTLIVAYYRSLNSAEKQTYFYYFVSIFILHLIPKIPISTVNKSFGPGGSIVCCASLLNYKHFLILFFLALFCDVLDAKRVREDFS